MSQIVADYDIKLRYKDSNTVIKHINRHSKKSGDNLRKTSASIETIGFFAWLDKLQSSSIQKLYDTGLYDHLITNLRKHFIDSDGFTGISRDEALQRYKYLYSFLTKEQLFKRNETFDKFTDSELGIKVSEVKK